LCPSRSKSADQPLVNRQSATFFFSQPSVLPDRPKLLLPPQLTRFCSCLGFPYQKNRGGESHEKKEHICLVSGDRAVWVATSGGAFAQTASTQGDSSSSVGTSASTENTSSSAMTSGQGASASSTTRMGTDEQSTSRATSPDPSDQSTANQTSAPR
jgi:hypothetical protein